MIVKGLELENVIDIKMQSNCSCSLCKKVITKGMHALKLKNGGRANYFIHKDCARGAFYSSFAGKSKKPLNKKYKKQIHQVSADFEGYCDFCRKYIKDYYIKDGKRLYHAKTKGACWSRYQRIVSNQKNSLR